LPSIADGFGLVVLQAISMGLPVIVSSNVGAADIVRDYGGGDVFQYNSINELTEKIINFYNSKKDKETYLNLKHVIDNNTWENYGNKLYDFIKKL
jgi:glycosyltransferase involved in cell wall biosynthesis